MRLWSNTWGVGRTEWLRGGDDRGGKGRAGAKVGLLPCALTRDLREMDPKMEVDS